MVDSDSDEIESEQVTPRATKRKIATPRHPKVGALADVSVNYRGHLLTSGFRTVFCAFACVTVVDAGDQPSFSLTTGACVAMIAWGGCD